MSFFSKLFGKHDKSQSILNSMTSIPTNQQSAPLPNKPVTQDMQHVDVVTVDVPNITSQENAKALRGNIKDWNHMRECRSDFEVDLRGADLTGANLTGANLSGANLSGANLVAVNLCGANLSGADLSRANLPAARLSGANLSGANLSGARLFSVILEGANLNDANLSGAGLDSVNLQGANLSGASFQGADLKYAKLEGIDLTSSKGLTKQQIMYTYMDKATKLPKHLK